MRQESWPDYLESKYHDQLPRLTEENRVYTSSMGMINVMMRESDEALAAYDIDGAFAAGGTQGLWDVDVRLREMDREGIAAEIVYCADQRVQDLFHSITNQKYPLDVCEAGIRAWHRWAVDTFGSAQDRLKFTALVGPAHDMEATLAEMRWVKNHGFVAAYVPNFRHVPRRQVALRPVLGAVLAARRRARARARGARWLRHCPGQPLPARPVVLRPAPRKRTRPPT